MNSVIMFKGKEVRPEVRELQESSEAQEITGWKKEPVCLGTSWLKLGGRSGGLSLVHSLR